MSDSVILCPWHGQSTSVGCPLCLQIETAHVGSESSDQLSIFSSHESSTPPTTPGSSPTGFDEELEDEFFRFEPSEDAEAEIAEMEVLILRLLAPYRAEQDELPGRLFPQGVPKYS